MLYFALCFHLMHGPVPPACLPEKVPAERLFAMLQRFSGLPVRRTEPELDTARITFKDRDVNRTEAVVTLVLRAHGIYVHKVVTPDGSFELLATRSARRPPPEQRRLYVKVYAPRYVMPERLIEALKETRTGKQVEIILEPRTGKLLFRGEEEEPVITALALVQKLDKQRDRRRAYHSYRCIGAIVREVNRELLQRLPRGVRARVVVVPYPKTNTLLVASGTEDWKVVLTLLRKIDPDGEVDEGR